MCLSPAESRQVDKRSFPRRPRLRRRRRRRSPSTSPAQPQYTVRSLSLQHTDKS